MRRKKKKSLSKKILQSILSVLLVYLVYLIICVTIPFTGSPDVSDGYKDAFDINRFYSDNVSVDRANIVETSQDALDVRLHMLNQAKKRIAISSFSIKNDQSCQEIASVILAAADRGVKVQIIVDGLTGTIDMKDDPMYYVLGTHPNVEIRYYNMIDLIKPWTANGRLHDKYIIIDDELLLLGGRNISNYFLGNYNKEALSYDRDIFVYNTAAGTKKQSESVINQVWSYFDTIWNCKYSKPVFDTVSKSRKKKVETAQDSLGTLYQTMLTERAAIFAQTDYNTVTVPTNKITLISNPIDIMTKEPYIWYELTELMKAAKDRVYIQTPYAVLNKDMYQGFKDIKEKVPEFRMLLNSRAGGDNFMASSDYTKNRGKVIKTGVSIFEYQGDQSMHDKSVLIDDDIAVIGSFNFDMRSTYLDTEVMLVVNGKEFNQQLEKCIYAMQAQSLPVQEDGSYGVNGDVKELEISTEKEFLFSITSVVFQLFRYLL